MDFEIYNCTGSIGMATDESSLKPSARTKNPSEPTAYLDLLGCSIQEARGDVLKGGIANYSYVVYFPLDDEDGLGKVRFGGTEMTMKQYLSLAGRVDIKEGHYFKGVVSGKEVNGQISFYLPNQLGCKLGITDINS